MVNSLLRMIRSCTLKTGPNSRELVVSRGAVSVNGVYTGKYTDVVPDLPSAPCLLRPAFHLETTRDVAARYSLRWTRTLQQHSLS